MARSDVHFRAITDGERREHELDIVRDVYRDSAVTEAALIENSIARLLLASPFALVVSIPNPCLRPAFWDLSYSRRLKLGNRAIGPCLVNFGPFSPVRPKNVSLQCSFAWPNSHLAIT